HQGRRPVLGISNDGHRVRHRAAGRPHAAEGTGWDGVIAWRRSYRGRCRPARPGRHIGRRSGRRRAMSLRIHIAHRIAAVPAGQWDALFTGELESHGYLRAFEEAKPEGFDLRYILVWDGDALVGASPAFVTSYRLDATVQGRLKRFTQWLFRLAPWLLSVPVA